MASHLEERNGDLNAGSDHTVLSGKREIHVVAEKPEKQTTEEKGGKTDMQEAYTVQRSWQFGGKMELSKMSKVAIEDSSECSFTLMTYNILGDMFVRDGEYTYCPAELRYMDSRHLRIIREIQQANADVICLQEVAKSHFEDGLKTDLYRMGYEGAYMPYPHKGHTDDGLAIFYRSRNLRLLKLKRCPTPITVENRLQEVNLSEEDRHNIQRLVERCQGCLIAKFLHIPSGKTFTVGNVHIKWTYLSLPGLSCLEAACAVHALKEVAGDSGFILTGDFNSTPDFGPYSLMTSGRVKRIGDLWKVKPRCELYPWNGDENADPNMTISVPLDSIQEESKDVEMDKKLTNLLIDIMQTNMPLKSAYKQIMGKEPEVTNCDAYAWMGYVHELCVDYMWYTDRHLAPKSVMEAPSRELIRKHHGLPSKLFPSDHISMAATFQLV